jgi:Na+/H+ antiporter NhaA
VQSVIFYLSVAVVFWFAVLESGVHATIAGVVLGLLTPTVTSSGRGELIESAKGLIPGSRKPVSDNSAGSSQTALRGIEELTISTEAPANRLVPYSYRTFCRICRPHLRDCLPQS